MASAPVPSSSTDVASSREASRQAGKKALEEFRKKKKKTGKKAAPIVGQAMPAVPDVVENPLTNANNAISGDVLVSDVDSNTASTSGAPSAGYQNGPTNSSRTTEYLSNGSVTVSASATVSDVSPLQEAVSDGGSKFYGNLSFSDLVNGHHEDWRGNASRKRVELSSDKDTPLTSKLSAFGNTGSSGSPAEVLPRWGHNSSSSQVHGTEQSSSYSSGSLFGKSESTYSQDYSPSNDIFGRLRATSKDSSQVEHSAYANNLEYGSTNNSSKIGDGVGHNANFGILRNASDSATANLDKEDHFLSTAYPTAYNRSRPSFLDSIGVQRTQTTQAPYGQPLKDSNSNFESSSFQLPNQQSSQSNDVDSSIILGSQEHNNEKVPYGNSIPPDSLPSINDHSRQHDNQLIQDFQTHGKDDGFATLEQLIEDLTKDKFSLQRGLEKNEELSQTLAADNSALTDKFNQQFMTAKNPQQWVVLVVVKEKGMISEIQLVQHPAKSLPVKSRSFYDEVANAQVISQLTSDMARLQDEIQAQLLALESVRTEYANAQLECNAADERGKVLAAEVILLEDKALKLRSNELKLEKEVEGLNSEISSYRRKVSSLEKERQHLQSTVEALQEEKKLLHSKLRSIPAVEKINVIEKPSGHKRDASTATEDLDTEVTSFSEAQTSTTGTSQDAGTSVPQSNNISDFPSFQEVSSIIPEDQLRMIDNINSLMSELAVEREELLRALRIESSNCSKLKELNKDLTHKLEIQTQRLELLTSQRMANENALAKPVDTYSINDATMYADEGDEVVERVLGWIIKFFPGGPKRRTSKLL